MPSAAGIGAVLLCAAGAAAQRDATITAVCMEAWRAEQIGAHDVGSPEYEVLMLRYKMGIAQTMGLPCTAAACSSVVVLGKTPPLWPPVLLGLVADT